MRTGNTIFWSVLVLGTLVIFSGLHALLVDPEPAHAESSAPAMDRIARELELMNRNLTQGNVKCVCECKSQ